MRVDRTFTFHGSLEDAVEGLRAYYLGAGYEEAVYEERRLEFYSSGSFKGHFGYKIEEVPIRLVAEFSRVEKETGESFVRIFLVYDVKTRFRLLSRLDSLYFELEIEELQRYFDTGIRRPVAARIDDVRTPVALTAMSNTLLTAVLVAGAGLLVGLELTTILPISVGVGLINFVSIVGFADIVVDGMDRLQRMRSQ